MKRSPEAPTRGKTTSSHPRIHHFPKAPREVYRQAEGRVGRNRGFWGNALPRKIPSRGKSVVSSSPSTTEGSQVYPWTSSGWGPGRRITPAISVPPGKTRSRILSGSSGAFMRVQPDRITWEASAKEGGRDRRRKASSSNISSKFSVHPKRGYSGCSGKRPPDLRFLPPFKPRFP